MHNIQVLIRDQPEVKPLKLREDVLRDAPVLDHMRLALLGADTNGALLIDNGANGVAEPNGLAADAGGGLPALLALLIECDLELRDLLGGDRVELVVVGCEFGLEGLGDPGFWDDWLCYIGESGIEESLDLRR